MKKGDLYKILSFTLLPNNIKSFSIESELITF